MNIIKGARGGITGHFGDTGVPGAHVPAHLGMDIGHGDMTAADRRVGAPAAGIVTAAGVEGTYGNRLIIDHGAGWSSLLGHLASYSVRVGQRVAVNEEVGVMGNTGGDWPVHLHQELRYNNVPRNPEPYLTGTASAGAAPVTNNPRRGIMETVIKAPNGAVVHIYPGGKTNFTSVEDYNAYREDIEFIKARGGTNLMSLPLIQDVVGVSWDKYSRLCAYVGAPPA